MGAWWVLGLGLGFRAFDCCGEDSVILLRIQLDAWRKVVGRVHLP